MFEGCLQAMAVYLAALGFTLERDGWRFEPVPDEPYQLRCRGQVTPDVAASWSTRSSSRRSIAGPVPTLFADLLCTVDGLKAFHCRRMGLRLVPDWPLDASRDAAREPLADARPRRADGATASASTTRSLLACAWGRPSEAFGADLPRASTARAASRACPARRTTSCRASRASTGAIGAMQRGRAGRGRVRRPRRRLVLRRERRAGRCPSRVLLEAALQPCGWLASLRRQRAHDRRGPPLPQPRRHRHAARARSAPAPARSRTRVKLTQRLARPRAMIIESLRRRRAASGDAAGLRAEDRLRLLPAGGARQPGRASRVPDEERERARARRATSAST